MIAALIFHAVDSVSLIEHIKIRPSFYVLIVQLPQPAHLSSPSVHPSRLFIFRSTACPMPAFAQVNWNPDNECELQSDGHNAHCALNHMLPAHNSNRFFGSSPKMLQILKNTVNCHAVLISSHIPIFLKNKFVSFDCCGTSLSHRSR